ncbi:MAG TPA: diaminopimelate epimerase, partial [Candidatus Paceibacterota bacterium]
MKLRFTKMHGLGNDFKVIDGVNQKVEITPEMAKGWADRHFGVGCDQILLVERSEKADFKYRIWNQDGGEVEQCGNGARCFVRFVHDKGLTDKKEIRVETKGGIISPKLQSDGSVEVDMGAPIFEPDRIPFMGTADVVQQLDIDGATVEITALSMGNPHAVQIVANIETAPVTTQGPHIENHALFPKRVNVGYVQIVDKHTI